VGHDGRHARIPESTKNSVTYRLVARARERWPQISRVSTRFKGGFGYIDAVLPDGETLRLCRLRYGGYANSWGFAIYRASHNDYQRSCCHPGANGQDGRRYPRSRFRWVRRGQVQAERRMMVRSSSSSPMERP
jgi:hypothetical protein